MVYLIEKNKYICKNLKKILGILSVEFLDFLSRIE